MKRLMALLLALLVLCPMGVGYLAARTDGPAAVAEAQDAEDTQTPEPDTTAGTARTLKYGDQGDEVARLQERLSELGYYSGRISGNFLEGTQNGVKRFQTDYGLEITGELDSQSAATLESAKYRALRYGDDGDDVKRLQQYLKNLKYLDANATGKYRAATQAAVKEFQEAIGLEATGEADLDTQRELFSGQHLAKGAQPTSTPAPDADLGDINDVVIAGDGESTADSEGGNEYVKKLSRGAKGAEVKEVQTRLTELGFFDGPVSGNYMNQTVAAVKAFQTHNGLTPDGITGKETWDMMFNSTDVVNASATPRPTPVPTPVPYAITVDVRNQVTIVYGRDENGEFTVPVKRMVCSTGLKATPSDVGEWTLNGRKARWCYFSKWGSHAQYWTRINSNIAFHSVIYNRVDYNAMSTKSYKKLGQRASHGCIRLLVSDAKWIYDNVGEGVVVTITEDLPDDEELRKSVAAPPLNSSKTGPVATPEPTPEPVYVSGTAPSEPLRKLKKGSTGEDVYYLQARLQELGYYTGTVTGGYYSGTTKAVKAYQKDNGIYPSGEATVETQESLFAGALAQSTPTPEPTPEASSVPTAEDTPVATPSPAPEE